eukprot:15153478-Ditylum_brightwellii.AAC.1
MQFLTAIAALKNYIIISADATSACVQSPPPTEPTFMRIDDQYAEWYYNKYGIQLYCKKVLPVLHALQGCPESDTLWEQHIPVDDFKVSGPDEDIIQDLINTIGGEIKLTVEKELSTHYNGIDYKQTCDCIKMHTKMHLTTILKNHGWECRSKEEDKIIKPICPNSIKELKTTVGPISEAEN